MQIDLRSAHVFVTEQVLHDANVVARLEEMGGEGVAKRMERNTFGEVGFGCGALDSALKGVAQEVVAFFEVVERINTWIGRGKHGEASPTRRARSDICGRAHRASTQATRR